jgi:hypothetical protein
VITVEIDGDVGQIEIAGGVAADGNGSDALSLAASSPA